MGEGGELAPPDHLEIKAFCCHFSLEWMSDSVRESRLTTLLVNYQLIDQCCIGSGELSCRRILRWGLSVMVQMVEVVLWVASTCAVSVGCRICQHTRAIVIVWKSLVQIEMFILILWEKRIFLLLDRASATFWSFRHSWELLLGPNIRWRKLLVKACLEEGEV